MSFKLANIINPFLNVRNQVKNVDGEWVDDVKPKESLMGRHELSITLNEGESFIIFEEWDKKVYLEALEIGFLGNEIYPQLHSQKNGGNYTGQMFYVVRAGSSRSHAKAGLLDDPRRDNTYLKGLVSDTGNGLIILKRSVYLPQGGRLQIVSDDDNVPVTFKCYWRVIDE